MRKKSEDPDREKYGKRFGDVITKEILIELNHVQKLSSPEMSKILGTTAKTIQNMFRRYGIVFHRNYTIKIGERIGILTVIGESAPDPQNKRIKLFLCRCDCGTVKYLPISRNKDSRSKSCGCVTRRKGKRHSKWRGCGDLSGKIFGSIRNNARYRELEFDVTIEEIWDLFVAQNKRCAMSGIELEMPQTASLDRIDSSVGYTIDNVQWVHKSINVMKMNMDQAEFFNFCKRITEHQEKLKYEPVDSLARAQRCESDGRSLEAGIAC